MRAHRRCTNILYDNPFIKVEMLSRPVVIPIALLTDHYWLEMDGVMMVTTIPMLAAMMVKIVHHQTALLMMLNILEMEYVMTVLTIHLNAATMREIAIQLSIFLSVTLIIGCGPPVLQARRGSRPSPDSGFVYRKIKKNSTKFESKLYPEWKWRYRRDAKITLYPAMNTIFCLSVCPIF